MRRFVFFPAAVLAMTALAAPAVAQEQTSCATGAALPDELSGWNDRQPMEAGNRDSKLAAATLQIGQGIDARLLRTPEVRYPVRPEKAGGTVSYGGLFTFNVEQAGTYRVALGSGAWIDVVKDGTVIESSAHGHGPECTGVRKMVDFVLQPGRYILQVAANGQEDLPLLVTRQP